VFDGNSHISVYGTVSAGRLEASTLGADCEGWVSGQPTYRVRVLESLPFVRLVVMPGLSPDGSSSRLSILIRGNGRTLCSPLPLGTTGSVLDGSLDAGDYDVYVVNAQPDSSYFRFVLTTSHEINSTNASLADLLDAPQVVSRASLYVARVEGVSVALGTRCDVVESTVGDGSVRVLWTLQCEAREFYRTIRPVSDGLESGGVLFADEATTRVDGNPYFVWREELAVLRDDETGSRGPFLMEFTEDFEVRSP
jgi:hypothetical protein